jgi:purine-nucleoside phosphorylase
MKIICSAWNQEIDNLSKHYDSEKFLKVALGVGYLEASRKLEEILQENKDNNVEAIIFIGTCGSYRKNLEIGEIVQIQKSRLLLLGKLDEKAYVPQKKYEDYILRVLKGTDGFKTADCMSSMEITNDDITAAKIYKDIGKEFLVENMELYGVVHVAEKHKLSCFSLLTVANYNNIFANREWENNQEEVSAKLCKFLNEVSL